MLLLALDVSNRGGAPGCGKWSTFPANPPWILNSTFNASGTTGVPLNPGCSNLGLGVAWQAMWGIILAFVAVFIPFSIFFYEAQEAGRKFQSRFCEAFQYLGVALLVAGVVLGLTFVFLSSYNIPIWAMQFKTTGSAPTYFTCADVVEGCITVGTNTLINPTVTLRLKAVEPQSYIAGPQKISAASGFFVFLACLMSFVGWWLFVIYTGTGLVTLPIDLIKGYMYRPKYIPKDLYFKLRDELRRRVDELLTIGKKMEKDRKTYDSDYGGMGYREAYRKAQEQRTVFLEFKKEIMSVEEDYEDLYACHEAWSSYNPLIPFVKLFAGIIAIFLSACWIIQILLYSIIRLDGDGKVDLLYGTTPVAYFLNDLMTWSLLQSGFALLGVFFIALFGLYLFMCNVNGNFKIGLRFLIVEVHPMKVGATYMSSFLVNVVLLLLQTPALIYFLAGSFSNTLVLTDIDTQMNNMIRFTTFFEWFFSFNIFLYLLLFFFILAGCLQYALPNNSDKIRAKKLSKKINKMQGDLEAKSKADSKKPLGLKMAGSATQRAREQAAREADAGGQGGDDDDGTDVAEKNSTSDKAALFSKKGAGMAAT